MTTTEQTTAGRAQRSDEELLAAYREGKTVREVARERNLLDEQKLNELLDPRSMTEPGVKEK
jgi:aspartate ammonia-lyase